MRTNYNVLVSSQEWVRGWIDGINEAHHMPPVSSVCFTWLTVSRRVQWQTKVYGKCQKYMVIIVYEYGNDFSPSAIRGLVRHTCITAGTEMSAVWVILTAPSAVMRYKLWQNELDETITSPIPWARVFIRGVLFGFPYIGTISITLKKIIRRALRIIR